MAGNVYRFDANVAFKPNGLALFVAAGAAFIFTGPDLQPAQAYYRPDPQVRIAPPKVIPSAPVAVPYVPANLLAAYRRDLQPHDAQREQLKFEGWFATFAAAGPAYRFNGPTVHRPANYPYPAAQDARREWLPLEPWAAAFYPADPIYTATGAWIQPVAAYRRDLAPNDAHREQFPLEPWFGTFAVAGPAYFFTGTNLQDPQAYLRAERALQLPAVPTTQAAPTTVPYIGLSQFATPILDARREWLLPEPWFGLFSPDPPNLYQGPPLQEPAAYVREARFPATQATLRIPASPDVVPYIVPQAATLAPPSIDARREWVPIEPWFGLFAPADAPFIYSGAWVQRAAYDRVWPVLGPVAYGTAPFQQVAAFVYPTPVPPIAAESRKWAQPAAVWAAIDASIPAFTFAAPTRAQTLTAAYIREARALSLSFAAKAPAQPPDAVPYLGAVSPLPSVPAATDARREWLPPRPWYGAFAPPPPPITFDYVDSRYIVKHRQDLVAAHGENEPIKHRKRTTVRNPRGES